MAMTKQDWLDAKKLTKDEIEQVLLEYLQLDFVLDEHGVRQFILPHSIEELERLRAAAEARLLAQEGGA